MLSFCSVFWMLSIDNSFCYDDVGWLLKVSTTSYEELFHFFPNMVYNDRPIGAIFLKILYSAFGLDYARHHVILVVIHLLNVFLTFLAAENVFGRKYKDEAKKMQGGVLTAAFFGIWSRTHMAVQWDAAIFDLLGTFWSLLSILFYLHYQNKKQHKGWNIFFTIFFYYLALRTKEMFLTLPILFILYEVWEMFLEKKRKPLTLGTKLSTFVGILFLSILFYQKFGGRGFLTCDASNPYYQSFHPVKLIHTLFLYCMLCFDLENGGWNYVFSISGLIGTVILTSGFVLAIIKAVKSKSVELILCYAAFGVSIAVVLPLINHVHVLYLYFPSIFVGLLIACTAVGLKKHDFALLCLMCLFFAAGGMKGNSDTKSVWLENAKLERQAWEDIRDIPAPAPGSSIYVKNLDNKQYTPFFYGEGAVCKLLYQDNSLNVKLLEENEWKEAEYTKPYVIWEYQNGRIFETERKSSMVKEVYPYPQEDGTLILGIVPDRIDNPMAVYVDETKLIPVIGETFISVQIPAELIEGKESITIMTENKNGAMSEGYVLDLTK